MPKRSRRMFVPVAVLAAVAVSGSAIAAAQQPAATPAPVKQSAAAAEPVGGPDTDTIQSGDQTTPDAPAKTATVKHAAAAGTTPTPGTTEAPGTEAPAASEAPGAAETPGSESATPNDGPGGHADAPGATVDHQFQGQE